MNRYVIGVYAQAACSLLDELSGRGIRAVVGYGDRKPHRTLIVRTSADPENIPASWRGFTVQVERPKEQP